jgi:uncharacterized membrane protein
MIVAYFLSVVTACTLIAGAASALVMLERSRIHRSARADRGSSSQRAVGRTSWVILVGSALVASLTFVVAAPWWIAPSITLLGSAVAVTWERRMCESIGATRAPDSSAPHRAPFPVGRYAVAYVISFATIGAGLLAWGDIPEARPYHWAAGGTANSFASKGWLTAFAEAWVGLFLTTTLLLLTIASHRRAAKATDPSGAGDMMEQESVDHWATQGTCASIAVAFSVGSALLGLLTWAEAAHGVAVIGVTVSMFGACFTALFGYQVARRAPRSIGVGQAERGAGERRQWSTGLFYANGGDGSTVVAHPSGCGWALNLGRPAAAATVSFGILLLVSGFAFAVAVAA